MLERWNSAPSDTAELFRLQRESRGISDPRIIDIAEIVAESASESREARLAAMMYLTSLLDPDTHYRAEELLNLEESLVARRVTRTSRFHETEFDPVGDPLRDRIIGVLTEISREDQDFRLRYAAEELTPFQIRFRR